MRPLPRIMWFESRVPLALLSFELAIIDHTNQNDTLITRGTCNRYVTCYNCYQTYHQHYIILESIHHMLSIIMFPICYNVFYWIPYSINLHTLWFHTTTQLIVACVIIYQPNCPLFRSWCHLNHPAFVSIPPILIPHLSTHAKNHKGPKKQSHPNCA